MFEPNENFLNKNQFKNKLEPTVLYEGPWTIQQVHTNGTVSILRNNYVEELIFADSDHILNNYLEKHGEAE